MNESGYKKLINEIETETKDITKMKNLLLTTLALLVVTVTTTKAMAADELNDVIKCRPATMRSLCAFKIQPPVLVHTAVILLSSMHYPLHRYLVHPRLLNPHAPLLLPVPLL